MKLGLIKILNRINMKPGLTKKLNNKNEAWTNENLKHKNKAWTKKKLSTIKMTHELIKI